MSAQGWVDLGFVRAWFERYWLGVWFGVVSGVGVFANPERTILFFDARLYVEAARAWLSGGNPWEVQLEGIYFAAPPPSLVPLAPFALLPEPIGVGLLVVAVLAGSIATIRMLRLEWWWILFPPLVHSMMSGNVQTLLVPLVIGGGGWLATLLKVYAAVPLLILGRWRQLFAVAVVLLVTAPLLPWAQFIADFGTITARLSEQARYSLPLPVLVVLAPLGLAALAVIGRERAAWMAVPALWPSAQLYYATLAMPTKSRLVGALIAVPVLGSALLALVALAGVEILQRWRGARAGAGQVRA